MYRSLSESLEKRIESDIKNNTKPDFAYKGPAIRRDMSHDIANIWRPAFARDTEKILYSAYYNRYSDKTQVFSFYHNDDITRRALHVQMVSRIARTIGNTLGLNLDLIEAIALGHDVGHTPFGHAGEKYLSELTYENAGFYFNHNIQSVRVLDAMFPYNLTLMTLNGIASHNGEIESQHYRPHPMDSFTEFDTQIHKSEIIDNMNNKWTPSTLEGCVVRICDMIAYIGKDRQDAKLLDLIPSEDIFTDGGIGTFNASIINDIEVDIIENSYGKPEISMSDECFKALTIAKRENYERIYNHPDVRKNLDESVRPMMNELYYALLKDVRTQNKESVIYRHHISRIERDHYSYHCPFPYHEENPHRIVADYIASMTDDYLVDLYRYLFPKGKYAVKFVGYFK